MKTYPFSSVTQAHSEEILSMNRFRAGSQTPTTSIQSISTGACFCVKTLLIAINIHVLIHIQDFSKATGECSYRFKLNSNQLIISLGVILGGQYIFFFAMSSGFPTKWIDSGSRMPIFGITEAMALNKRVPVVELLDHQ